jgi:two-component system, NarL family, sensor histidine kinase UhpB
MKIAAQNKIISINELWQFFNRSANLFCIMGPDKYLNQVNPHFIKILGYSEEHLLSTPYNDFIHPDDREYSVRQSARVRKENSSIHFRNRILDASGHTRWISWTAAFIEDEDNVYLIGQDFTEAHEAEEKLKKERQDKYKAVLEATLKGQEKERIEIGRELHDNINQMLATAIMYQKMAFKEEFDCREMSLKTGEIVQMAIEEIRSLSKSLVGPDIIQMSLFECIRELLETVRTTTKIRVVFNFVGDFEDLSAKVKKMIFRIFQEQINNILKHAEANKIFVSLLLDKNFMSLNISDDGKGFDINETKNGIGLKNIRSRIEIYNGVLEIISAAGKGCALRIIIPAELITGDSSDDDHP